MCVICIYYHENVYSLGKSNNLKLDEHLKDGLSDFILT